MLIKKKGMLRQECKFSCNSDNFRGVFGNSYFLDMVAKTLTNNLSRNLTHCQHEQRGCLICAARSSEGSGWVGATLQGRQGRAGPGGPGGNGGPGGPGGQGGRAGRVGMEGLTWRAGWCQEWRAGWCQEWRAGAGRLVVVVGGLGGPGGAGWRSIGYGTGRVHQVVPAVNVPINGPAGVCVHGKKLATILDILLQF